MSKAPAFEGFGITEREIRYAMSNSQSNAQAAEFLRIHIVTYRKYAKLFIDESSGLNLYELHNRNCRKKKEQKPKERRRRLPRKFATNGKELMEKILSGELKPPAVWKFKYFLFREGIFKEECMECGFHECRITDGKTPIQLIFLDGNARNGKRENLKLLCYNHYFLYIGNIWGRPKKPEFFVPKEFEWE